MKIRQFRKVMYEDFVGYAKWFENFFDLFNRLADVFSALDNKLTFRDNHAAAIQTVTLNHNTPKTINTKTLSGQIGLVLVGKSPALSSPLYWTSAGPGAVTVTASFVGSPTAPQEVTLYLFQES